MVLHSSNFEIPARFSFQPFVADWRFVTAKTVDWAEEPKLRKAFVPADENPDKSWVSIRIEASNANDVGMPLLGVHSLYEVLLNRTSVPPDVLRRHENYRNTPDIAGRNFTVLICQKPEFKNWPSLLEPGTTTKNAWFMRDEFLGLEAHPEFGWDWSVQQFLSKWGLWGSEQGYVEAWDSSFTLLTALYESVVKERITKPDFTMVNPHLLKAQQEGYRKALLPRSARNWLSLHPPSLETAGEFPFFRMWRNYCRDAIEATITIDHLAKRQFGICKRCHGVFQRETRHEKNYCSERCFNAAGVQRWREKQRKAARKGAKRNAKG